MERISVAAVAADPSRAMLTRLERAADRQQLCARIGANIGVGLMIIGAVLTVLGLLGAEEFVSDRGRIISVPAGLLFTTAGSVIVWITRPTLVR